jgi:hypothetical protein
LRRRHTQQSGSEDVLAVSDPQTEHFPDFGDRSAKIDRVALSRISSGITGSVLGCVFRLIFSIPSSDFTIAETSRVNN